jgi:3-hydroxyanthranilate 3,4-dioxygenase
MIPGGVPHAPQRPPNTLGLVIERRRPPGEQEALRFVCESCGAVVEDLMFDCADIVEHFREAMLAFWADEERSTCQCGVRVMPPQPIDRIEFEPKVKIVRKGDE